MVDVGMVMARIRFYITTDQTKQTKSCSGRIRPHDRSVLIPDGCCTWDHMVEFFSTSVRTGIAHTIIGPPFHFSIFELNSAPICSILCC